MSIDVTIKRPGEDFNFIWDGDSDDARALWVRCEDLARDDAHDPRTIAAAAIQEVHDHGEPKSLDAQRGLRVWATYAVLRFAAHEVDLSGLVDHAGVLAGPPTVFDLAEHQEIKAVVSLPEPGHLSIEINGRPSLDS
jgi:hypothetical protein